MTVRAGAFRLDCRTIKVAHVDCGSKDPSLPATVEVGTLWGTGSTVWFVQDPAKRVALTGCVRHSQAAAGCGPEDPYHFDWKIVAHGIAFSHFVGLGDQDGFPELSNWTAQPWTRIS